ncbi:MAG: bifunctional riboflavin kinase/FAD synthetase [Deltaproteobacteria bacterium]|jgi:riboflavin kinase/FMN adenylyltransferase|nr:bifunctional riboflavin kinase/FAD synthetase [Deltaproteobacteria bacterium]
MLIIPDWLSCAPLGRTVMTIGVFDGIHLGHQFLIQRVIDRAKALGATSLVLTFEPHPLVVLSPAGAPEILTTFDRKAEILGELGLEALGLLRFDQTLSDMRALDFLNQVIAARLKLLEIHIGPDFRFGRGAEGHMATLRDWGRQLDPPVKARSIQQIKGPREETYSSSHIRGLIKVGLVEEAAGILGRTYRISGVVETGQARGRLLGYPTANLGQVPQLIPGPGVYATRVILGALTFHGMTSVGYNPTFSSRILTVETYIFDFSEDCYGEKLEVEFVARLRGVIRFDSAESLVRQLGEDEKMARALLAAAPVA